MQNISLSIITNLIECILQSRIQIQKKQIRRFDQINKEIQKKKHKTYSGNLTTFFNNLLITQKYQIHNLLKNPSHDIHIKIIFTLHQRTNPKNTILTEIWILSIQEFTKPSIEEQSQQYFMIVTLFQEMLLFLNQQPLFSEYQRNQKMKNKYSIHYQIELLQGYGCEKDDNILLLPNKYMKDRVCQYLWIQISCYFLPKSSSCWDSYENKPLFPNKNQLCEKKIQEQTLDTSKKQRKHSNISITDNKLSLYEFYDKQLDFVFLSSDDQQFKNQPANQVKQMELDLEQSEEFQMLVLGKDQQFVTDNKDLMTQFTQREQQYFTY